MLKVVKMTFSNGFMTQNILNCHKRGHSIIKPSLGMHQHKKRVPKNNEISSNVKRPF